jgi:23S rRNA pseudouridine1911/1915/1917 synthase
VNDLFPIVHEDEDLLVINKPAGLVCHPTKGDVYSSLISRIRLYLGPDATAHLVNRLDRETGGLTLVAKTDEAARELRRLWEAREVVKEYRAIVHGCPPREQGIIDAPLGKDEQSEVAVKDCVREDGAEASTEYRCEKAFERAEGLFSLLQARPRTGRKHQIRLHLAHLGCPIVGDKIYGGDPQLYLHFVNDRLAEAQKRRLILPNQALHAVGLEFLWRGERRRFAAELDPVLIQFLAGEDVSQIPWPAKPA